MALQGTLETFSVPEVLRLLSNTKKTGLLALDGDRGHGEVWLGDGSIISARSDHEGSGDIDATLFDLLRFSTGDFLFEADATPGHPVSDEVDVDAALGRAEELLSEWRELETVVPSLLVGVRLVRELQGESVTVSSEQWRSLAAIGGGTSAAGLGQRLELGELDTCRRIRDLVEASLIELSDDADEPEPAVESPEPVAVAEAPIEERDEVDEVAEVGYDDEPELVDHDLSQDEVASLSTNLASFVARPEPEDDVVVVDEPVEQADEAPLNGHGPTDEDVETDPARELAAEFDSDEPADTVETADEFLAQLTNLSPKAAAAIEATAEEATARAEADSDGEVDDDDHGPVDAEDAPEGDEEINRNLLLKFLSSTKN